MDIEINALVAVYDSLILKRYAGGDDNHRWSRWNMDGLKVGITVGGTLNDMSDQDVYWQMEVAVPFAEIPLTQGRTPKVGEEWWAAPCRYDYSVYLPNGVELSSSAPLKVANFHQVEDYSVLRFVKQP